MRYGDAKIIVCVVIDVEKKSEGGKGERTCGYEGGGCGYWFVCDVVGGV